MANIKLNFKEKALIVFIVIILIIGLLQLVDNVRTYYYVNIKHTYVIGQCLGHITIKSGTFSDYYFYFNGKRYEDRTSVYLAKDSFYFIKVYPLKPKFNLATRVLATHKDMENMPEGGYLKLPHK